MIETKKLGKYHNKLQTFNHYKNQNLIKENKIEKKEEKNLKFLQDIAISHTQCKIPYI